MSRMTETPWKVIFLAIAFLLLAFFFVVWPGLMCGCSPAREPGHYRAMPDGSWHPCDENGRLISPEVELSEYKNPPVNLPGTPRHLQRCEKCLISLDMFGKPRHRSSISCDPENIRNNTNMICKECAGEPVWRPYDEEGKLVEPR